MDKFYIQDQEVIKALQNVDQRMEESREGVSHYVKLFYSNFLALVEVLDLSTDQKLDLLNAQKRNYKELCESPEKFGLTVDEMNSL